MRICRGVSYELIISVEATNLDEARVYDELDTVNCDTCLQIMSERGNVVDVETYLGDVSSNDHFSVTLLGWFEDPELLVCCQTCVECKQCQAFRMPWNSAPLEMRTRTVSFA